MKLCVFGATGRTGLALLDQALAAGHEVTAVARAPEKLKAYEGRVRIVEAGFQDAAAVGEAVAGQDAVISTLGTVERKRNTVLSDGTRVIIDAMKAAGTRRFIVVTSLGCRESVKLIRSFVFRELIVKRLAKEIWADKDRQEELIEASGLDYTIARPGGLTDKPATGAYQVLGRYDPLPKSLMIARADVADFLLKAAGDPSTIGEIYSLVPE